MQTTARERVLAILKSRRWTPGFTLTTPAAGGSEGLRRLRELRAQGYDIKRRKIEGSTAYEYRLVGHKG